MAATFEGCPVSRLCFLGHTAASLLLSPAFKRDLAFNLGRTLARGEAWRLVTHHAAFETLGEAALGAIALYRFRRFERYLGSRKFVCFAAMAAGTTTALLAAGARLLPRRDEGAAFLPASGPYGLVFGLFGLFHRMVPVTRPRCFSVAGIHFSDKALMYALGLQLLVARGRRSAYPALLGLGFGVAYLGDALRLHAVQLPAIGPFAPRYDAAVADAGDDDGAGDDGAGGALAAADAPATEPRFEALEPSEAHVASLVAMGFDRDRAFAALLACNDNVERAADQLLA